MKKYPTISKQIKNQFVYAFDKLDGSNIRVEWTKKRGFLKYGRRNGLLDHSCPQLLSAPRIFEEKYGDDLPRILYKMKIQKATIFCEFYGPSSFAGNHSPEEDHTVTIFDVAIPPKGILPPKEFLKHFEKIDHAPLLYKGIFSKDLEIKVRDSTLKGMTFEGVVCKGKLISPGLPLMFKVKSEAWLDKLKKKCAGDLNLFNRLS